MKSNERPRHPLFKHPEVSRLSGGIWTRFSNTRTETEKLENIWIKFGFLPLHFFV